MVVEERRGQVQRDCSPLHAGSLERTFFVDIASGHTVRHITDIAELEVTLQADIPLIALTELVNLFLPVCIGISQRQIGRVVGIRHISDAPVLRHSRPHLVSCHDIQKTAVLRQGCCKVRAHMRYCGIVLAAFLSCDDNHTIRRTRTVNSCRRGVLQHSKGLDITRVDT